MTYWNQWRKPSPERQKEITRACEIRKLRKQRGADGKPMSQRAIAEELGISQGYVELVMKRNYIA